MKTKLGQFLLIAVIGLVGVLSASAQTNLAQPSKNELIGTWVGVDKPKNKITFTADEMTSIEDGTEYKVKYTRLSSQEFEFVFKGQKRQAKATVEGEVLTITLDNQPTKFRRESSGSTVNKAQPFKNELIGTWSTVTSSRKLATFTADEVTFYYDLADLDEGRGGPDLEEKKFKYTHLSNNEIELTPDGKVSQTKIILDGEVLIVINDKGIVERYTRGSGAVRVQPFKTELIGTWIGVDDPKVKIVFTAGEVAFKSLGVDGKYTFLSNNVIRIEVKGEVVLAQFTFEGEVLTMTVAKGSTKYKRESTNAANSNANANTTSQTAPIDYQKFKELSTLSGHSDQVRSVAFSPDGKTLASGSDDKTVKLWNVADGKELRSLSGHSSIVTSVAFSPDGKTLASVSWDKTVKLWNVADGKEPENPFGTLRVFGFSRLFAGRENAGERK